MSCYDKKTRLLLAFFCAGLTISLSVFVWIMLAVSKSGMSQILLGSLALVVFVTITAQVIYALKGQIFEFDGRLAFREILFAVICFQVVMQFSFGFSVYAVNQTELQNKAFDSAYSYFTDLQNLAPGNRAEDYLLLDLEASMPACVESVLLADKDETSSFLQYYRFPIKNGQLLMKKSVAYFTKHLQDFLISLVVSLVISVLLMAEVVYLAIKLIDGRNGQQTKTAAEPAQYLRQIAFLFYFTGFLCASFIPLMARNFAESNPNADFIAGLPYSVEALFNCVAILLTPKFFHKKGWKPLYLFGAALFAAGLVLSALAPNVYAFIGSRALVGIGYGLCWMTLRNVATLSGNLSMNFAGLSSGIYAGMMCGVAFGAVLADLFGFRAVLLISAIMALIALIFPITLKNSAGAEKTILSDSKIRLSLRDIAIFIIFLAAIVIPTGIADAFCGFLLPLYINHLDLPTAYIGRVSLIYNLCLVYISSSLLLKLVWSYIKNPLLINTLHLLIVSVALFAAAYLGGFTAILIAGLLLGSADGFGFSVQNAYILDTRLSMKLGTVRMMTLFSLFKKFVAMLAPPVFGLFIMNGFSGLGAMGGVFIACAIFGTVFILLMSKTTKIEGEYIK